MGMAAVDMTMEQAPERRVATVDYQQVGIWRLRELARQQHPDHTDEAARVFVQRLLDMEVERRIEHLHENPGYHPFSPVATLGEQPGGGTAAADPMVLAYDRGIRVHRDHEAARRWIAAARVPPRQLLALLIQTRKLDRRVKGEWGKNYDQIAANACHYAQLLGWPPGMAAGAYRNGQAVKFAAHQARCALTLLAKVGAK